MLYLLNKEQALSASSQPLQFSSKTLPDVIALYHLINHGDEFIPLADSPRPRRKNGSSRGSQRNKPMMSKVPQRSENIPNRWPAALPLMKHNIYWLKSHGAPAICLGLQPESLTSPGDGLLRLLPLAMHSAAFELSLNYTQVEPVTAADIQKRCDDRLAGFIQAMIAFSAIELEKHENCRWYIYPAFIISLVTQPAVWASWRSTWERASRGKGDKDRKQTYLRGLLEEAKVNSAIEVRQFGCNLPWDDEPLCEEFSGTEVSSDVDVESDSERSDSSIVFKSERKNGKPSKSSKNLKGRGRPDPSLGGDNEDNARPKSRKKEKEEIKRPASPVVPRDLHAHRRSPLNLYWMERSRLPCLFYDDKAKENDDIFRVQPVCCVTYHCKHSVSSFLLYKDFNSGCFYLQMMCSAISATSCLLPNTTLDNAMMRGRGSLDWRCLILQSGTSGAHMLSALPRHLPPKRANDISGLAIF